MSKITVATPQLNQSQSSLVTTVASSNLLLRSHYDELNSVIFLRLFNLLASQIQQKDKDFQVYRVPYTAVIADNVTGGTYYKVIDKVVEEAMRVIINIPESDKRLTKYTLFSKCTLDTERNIIEIGIHPDLKPYLLNLKNHFTRYRLEDFLRLSSVYSQRLFQLLSSWCKSPYWRVEIDALHDMMNSAPSMRKDFKQFRVRALETAQKEILRQTGLYFRYETEKQRRKVKFLIFYFEPDSEESEVEKAKQATHDLQKKSNKCFEKFLKKNQPCVPKKYSKICFYCLERGRKSIDQLRLIS